MLRHKPILACLSLLLIVSSVVHGNVVTVEGNQVLQDGVPVKLVGLRCSNALMSDNATSDLLNSLDLYQEYGLNAISVFLMGSRFGDVKGYQRDGSMNAVYRSRLTRILEDTRSRGMIVVVGCLYWSTSRAKEELADWTQQDANRAISRTAGWLGEMGFRHVILDPDNEGMAGREMKWETESMVQVAKAANPQLVVANNTRKPAPSADLNMHFGPRDPNKPYLDSESTPRDVPFESYWGRFSKETHQANPGYYNYSRIGRYTVEMKRSQLAVTRDLLENHNGILFASTWLQRGNFGEATGPMTLPGGHSDLGSGDDLSAEWNVDIDTLHPDAGIRWWLEYVREWVYSNK